SYEKITKKERIKLDRKRQGLDKTHSGIKSMNRLPDAVFVIDVRKEEIAVAEANKLGIPVIAVVDTNCSPEGIDYVIPGNDDALAAVRLFASRIADAVLEGQQMLTEGGATTEATGKESEQSTERTAASEPESSETQTAGEDVVDEGATETVGAEPVKTESATSEDVNETESAEVLAAR